MVAETKKGSGGNTVLTSVLFVLLLVALVTGLSAFFLFTRHTENLQQYLPQTGELRLLANRISVYASASAGGEEEAFPRLRESRQEFIRLLDDLKTGSQKPMLAAPVTERSGLQEVESVWLELRSQVDTILNSKEAIMSPREAAEGILGTIPDLLSVSAATATGLVANKASEDQVYHATRQLFVAQRMHDATTRVLMDNLLNAQAADQVSVDLNELKSVVRALLKGDATLGIEAVTDENIQQGMLEASAILGDMDDSLRLLQEGLVDAGKKLPAEAGGQERLTATTEALDQRLSDLALSYAGDAGYPVLGSIKVEPALITMLGAVAIGLLLILGLLLLSNARKRKRLLAEQDQLDREAVHLLLDEMSRMADGDLSVEATAGEGITGAVADSVNRLTENMRSLLSSVNDASTRAYSSIQENRANIMHLAEASEHQREQIGTASSKINTLAQALSVMANEAGAFASSAAQSVKLVEKGDNTVRLAISALDRIGEQVNQASARVRRLDENLQASGEMVELVEDIADQTNILALNAAMQAAVAGEAGRGFAVVADGVQKQAERFASVSKQIESMVQASQAEADKSVNSMERSAKELSTGMGLAENAGRVMQELKEASGNVSGLAANFAEYAQIQSRSALSIGDSMGVIREISQQNTENTDSIVLTTGELARDIEGLQSTTTRLVLRAGQHSG